MIKPALVAPKGVSAIRKGVALTKNFIVKQSPIILTVAAVGGVITTAIMASKSGILASKLIEKAEKEKKEIEGGNATLTIAEKAQASWQAYVPTAISAGFTIGAIVGSSTIFQKRQAAVAALYALSEASLKEYQEKTEKEFGQKKEQYIRDLVNTDHASNVVTPKEFAAINGDQVLVKDVLSGRVFLSSVNKIRSSANDLNEAILGGDMCASLNEFYDAIGLDHIDLGSECGWNLDCLCKPYFTAAMTSDMHPILLLDWERHNRPIPTYRDI